MPAPAHGPGSTRGLLLLGVRVSLVTVGVVKKPEAGNFLHGSKAASQAKPCPLPCSREKSHLCNCHERWGKVWRHQYLLGQMVPAMRMVAASRFT